MAYLFSSESVSEGHPDKVADQISDALLDQFLAYDENAHCAIESFCTTGQVIIMGEVRSSEYVDLQAIARKTMRIVWQNIVFALVVKFACLALVAVGAADMWAAIFADVGVMVLAVLNAIRALAVKNV